MGILSAMYSGVSGLSVNGNAMNVIGNNLANSNTIGFKASRSLFSDLLASEVSSATGDSQIGRGAGLSTVDVQFSQGTFKETESNTDLAIKGPGLFIVSDPNEDGRNYTRAGAFRFDSQGYMTNPQGLRVQGYDVDDQGNAVGTLQDIQVPVGGLISASQTRNVSFSTNLNADAESLSPFDISDPSGTSNFATSINIYDSLGDSHQLTTYFTKTGDNTWKYTTTVPVDEVDASSYTTGSGLAIVAQGTFSFDSSGEFNEIADNPTTGTKVDADTLKTAAIAWNNGADQSQQVNVSLNLSQYSGQSELVSKDQDGYAAGSLSDVSVDKQGYVTGNYSNGESRKLAQLGLAKFTNVNGLKLVGNNLFESTDASGLPSVGTPGSGVGEIRSNALEQSNVDIAKEFTDMITTQRAYQANARTISTTDKMLNEVVNLVR